MGVPIFYNNISFKIEQEVSPSDTVIKVADTFGIPDLTNDDYIIGTILAAGGQGDMEIVHIVSVNEADNELTIERGQEDTSPQAFLFGSILALQITAGALNDILYLDDLGSSTGSQLVGYKNRTVYDRLEDITSIWDFTDHITNKPDPNDPETWDWSPAAQVALDQLRLKGRGGSLYIKSGNYLFGETLTTDGLISLVGDGINNTNIICSKGFLTGSVPSTQSHYDSMTLSGMTIKSAHKALYNGLDITVGSISGYKSPRVIVENVEFLGDDMDSTQVHEWKYSIRLINADNCYINNVGIKGKESSYTDGFDTATIGIVLENSTNTFIVNSSIFRTMFAFDLSGQSEGTVVNKCVVVAVKKGANYHDLITPSNNQYFSDTHISARECAVDFGETTNETSTNYHQMVNCFFLKRQDGGVFSDNYRHVMGKFSRSVFSNCQFATNELTDRASGGDIAFLLGLTSSYNNFSNLVFINPGTGFLFSGANVVGNRAFNISVIKIGNESWENIPITDLGQQNTVLYNDNNDPTDITYWQVPQLRVGTSTGEAFRVLSGASNVVSRVEVYGRDTGDGYAALRASSDSLDNVDLHLLGKGTGRIAFGPYSPGSGTISGYMEVKDTSGVVHKLAVIT